MHCVAVYYIAYLRTILSQTVCYQVVVVFESARGEVKWDCTRPPTNTFLNALSGDDDCDADAGGQLDYRRHCYRCVHCYSCCLPVVHRNSLNCPLR